jgi:hypothetical protein
MESKARRGLFPELWHLIRTHVRDYAMFIALAVIFILFGIFSQGNFLSPRNLTNLINQTGYIAVMACIRRFRAGERLEPSFDSRCAGGRSSGHFPAQDPEEHAEIQF